MTLAKDFVATERLGIQFIVQSMNLSNHIVFADSVGTSRNINQPTRFGRITVVTNGLRSMELGLRFHF